jgi:hypothetical protein
MKIFDYRWIGNYSESMLVHDPSSGNPTAKAIACLGFTVKIQISLIM